MRLLVALLLPLSLFCQQQSGQSFIATSNTTFAWSTTSLASVADISTCSTARTNTLIITDTIRGGKFYKYTGNDAADNGMIFTDALGNKWKRDARGIVNMLWYGNNRVALLAAKDYIYSHPDFQTIYIPQGNYSISDSVKFDRDIIIKGDGVIGYPATTLTFPEGKTGLIFSYTSGQSGFGAEMTNIKITGQFTPGYNNTSVHAITIRTRVKFTNVIVSQFDGNGFHVSACGTAPNGDNNNYGIADNSIFNSVKASYCTNGFFSEGCDGHILQIDEGCDFSENRRWGYYGNGQEGGDNLIKTHFAFNGVAIPGAKSVVTYNTKYYVALAGHDGYFGDATDSNYNKPPDSNPAYWLEVTPTMVATEWESNYRYYSGGAAIVRNVNARTIFDNCYVEGSEPPIFLNTRSQVLGGIMGAGVVGGAFWNVLYGEMQLQNAGLLVEKYAHIGTTTYDAQAQLKVYNDYSETSSRIAIKSEGSTNEISHIFKNSTGATGQIQYIDSSFKIYSKTNVLAATIDSAGITANKFFGDGSALTGIIGVPVYAQVTGSNATTTGQALTDITGLSIALTTNAVYEFEAVMTGSTTAVTTGTGYGVQYSAAGASIEALITASSTSTATKTLRISALNTSAQAFLTSSAQTGGILIKGRITTGANSGNLTIKHLKVTSGTSTIFIGSFLKVIRIS